MNKKFHQKNSKFLDEKPFYLVRLNQKEQNQRGRASQILLNLHLRQPSQRRLKQSPKRKMLNEKILSHQKNFMVRLKLATSMLVTDVGDVWY